MMVAFAPGGTADFTARVIADKMQHFLGQPIAVENKPGANGAIGAEYVAKSEPRRLHAVLHHGRRGGDQSGAARRPALRSAEGFRRGRQGRGEFHHPGRQRRHEGQFDARSRRPGKAQPNSITIGITGRGAISDLGRQLFEDAAGIKLQGVPYRGAAPALTDMLAGHLDGLFGDVPTIMAQVKAGKLKALAATSSERSDIFPDVPTFVEQGFAGVVGDNWDAVLAPAGTPQPIIAKLNAALVAAVNDPEVRTRLHNSGTTPAPSTPEAFEKYLHEENVRWSKIIREKGIKGE